MAAPEPAQMLRKLQNSFEKIKSLLAWRQFKREEARPGLPPSFVIDDCVEEDLRNEYSQFTATAGNIHGILNDNRAILPTGQRKYIKDMLWELERRVRSLNLPAQLYPVNSTRFF